MKKKISKVCAVILVVGALICCCSLSAFATYFEDGGGTYKTYINAANSFSSFYFTDANPDMRFE